MAYNSARVRVGTRGSRLALRQTELIVTLLGERFPGVVFTTEVVRTEGDRVQDRPISQIGDKGVFVRSIERSLLARDIDLAVHSLKDIPADIETPGLELAAYSEREDPRDVLLSPSGATLDQLPSGARVGTSSLRRRVQLQAIRPDLVLQDIRGNVDTRLRKLEEGQYEAIVLAAAGLLRLGLADRITEYFSVDRFVPDAGQGILAVQTRTDDAVAELARAVDVPLSQWAATAERSTVLGLGGDCHSPVGAYATVQDDRIWVRAMAAREDGSRLHRAEAEGPVEQAAQLGRDLGRRLLRYTQA